MTAARGAAVTPASPTAKTAMPAIVAGADTKEHDMTHRFALATPALLAPLALTPAIAQHAMHNGTPTPKSAMADTSMSHGAMSPGAVHGTTDGSGGSSANADHAMSHGGTMAPAGARPPPG